MTAGAHPRFRTVSFADPDGHVWGAALDGGPEFIALGTPAGLRSAVGPEAIEWSEEDERWLLTGDGFELLVSPVGESVAAVQSPPAADASAGGAGLHQLCHMRGRLSLDGAEQTIDTIGARTDRAPGPGLESLESVRSVSAWFEGNEGLTLLALRPKRADGHDDDLLTAAVFENGSGVPVSDPRLSTTYTSTGLPARASLELWLGDGETQSLRRAAGEAAGPAAEVQQDGLEARVELFRWHSKGLEGRGVYLLARPR
jgi:hypothetical protein